MKNSHSRIVPPFRMIFPLAALLLISFSCSKDDEDQKNYTAKFGWNCATGQNCQDVFNLEFEAKSKVTFQANQITGGSIAQIALYGPGIALGGINLFTTSTKELACNVNSDCDKNTTGQTVNSFNIPSGGTYRLAISRDWGRSCGGTGTYQLTINSDKAFKFVGQTAEDAIAKTTESECK